MNPFPEYPLDPLGRVGSTPELGQRFDEAMDPFWKSAQALLSKQKPKVWVGYRCDVDFRWDPSSGRYRLGVRFCDGVSNRAKALSSTGFIESMANLHEAYWRFDRQLEWKRVSLTQFQDQESKQWRNGIEWGYGRAILEAGSGEGGTSANS